MKKKLKSIGIELIVGAIFGGICGYMGINFIEKIIPSQESYTGESLILCGVVIICLVLSVIFHTVLHELGHLLFGKLSGYDFVSFRIFNVMFIKENDKLVRKKFNIVGTSGQCLMSPPESVNGNFPYILYNLGGSFMNFITSGICYVFYILFSKTPPFYAMIFVLFTIIGLFLGLVNIIPAKMGGVANDGFNALTLGKREIARHAFWLQLRINALTTKGVRFRDMPAEWFDLPDDDDLNDVLVASTAILRFNYLMDRHEFEKGKALIEHLLHTAEKMLDVHKNELRCELLFLEIIGECRKEEIDCLYTKQLEKYIKATSSYVSRQRLLYAYASLVSHDKAEAKKVHEQFNKSCATYPNAGEIFGERELIDLIDNMVKIRTNP